ncbi:MAG: tetraacyldisaccharide 4'-kinase [Acidobacteriota bacterium]|nr:tetraacyldisaccharide 4'-kinase [Acidobacteriota bacterium]
MRPVRSSVESSVGSSVKSPVRSPLRRPLLLPLVPLYAAAVRFKRWMFRQGLLQQRRLEGPVISVGSVSAGGAGKTPIVLMLATMLRQRGYAVRILTRGYGRTAKHVSRVQAFDDPRCYGDEPVLLAQRSGVPVYVGAQRYDAGVLAEQQEPSGKTIVHLLDDGFQHRQLEREIDIVLLTKEDVDDQLLPAGNLREPLSTLAIADVVVLREDEAAALRPIVAKLSSPDKKPAVWVIRRRLSLGVGGEVALPTMPLAFCGIARPKNFLSMLAGEGYEPTAAMIFADHQNYGDQEIARLLTEARRCGANGFVTTEKDAVKLTPILRDRLATIGPLIVTRLSVELLGEKDALLELVGMVGRLDRRKR